MLVKRKQKKRSDRCAKTADRACTSAAYNGQSLHSSLKIKPRALIHQTAIEERERKTQEKKNTRVCLPNLDMTLRRRIDMDVCFPAPGIDFPTARS